MKNLFIIAMMPMLLIFCNKTAPESSSEEQKSETVSNITQPTIDKVVLSLTGKYGEAQKSFIAKGVSQVANLWRAEDGAEADFETFCNTNFIGEAEQKKVAFEKVSRNFEILYGNFNKMEMDLNIPLDLDAGEVTPIDMLFGGYSPSAHLSDDFFSNKIAFVIALNFPAFTLPEKEEMASKWSRLEWAYARLGDAFTSRPPAELLLNKAEVITKADAYISEYNIYMGNLVNNQNETLFAEDLKLITHWGLRDELKSNYKVEGGLAKQQMVFEVMKRIIDQSIPKEVINNNKYKWNPAENKVYDADKEIQFEAENEQRYQILLNNFKAVSALDKYYPQYPTYIKRSFDAEMELSQEDVEALFVELVSAPQIKKVAELIKKRLGRDLQPFDIWYNGFAPKDNISEEELDKIVSAKYQNTTALQADLPVILTKLGFNSEKANYICDKITVDASRGAGHAAGASMKGDKARLRTRIGEKGMNYKGYNIAVHEFGHNVEQTISLYDVDYYLISGVPSTAFTEALAFIFQKRDLELLGMKNNNPDKMHLMALTNLWSCYEIMGVSLVDMNVWKWLYENPNATAAQLKEATLTIAKDVWNKYYAEVFGIKDQTILAIYSHMIDYPLYLSAYPIGHLIDFQIEQYLEGKDFATEIQRIYQQGRLVPQTWMKEAVGVELSNKPMLDAVDLALAKITE